MSLDYSDAQEVLRMVLGLRTAIYPAPDLAAAKRCIPTCLVWLHTSMSRFTLAFPLAALS